MRPLLANFSSNRSALIRFVISVSTMLLTGYIAVLGTYYALFGTDDTEHGTPMLWVTTLVMLALAVVCLRWSIRLIRRVRNTS